MIDSEQIIIWPEKKGRTKRPSNLNMLHIWFGTILMIYLIVWLFFISFHFHLFRATYGTLDRILSVSLLWSNELFTSDLFYVNLLTFRCNQAYRVDDAVHSLESTYLLWCILFRLFAAHNSIVHIFFVWMPQFYTQSIVLASTYCLDLVRLNAKMEKCFMV